MRFLKLELTWMESEWLIVLSPGARLAWVKLLGYCKASGLGGTVKRLTPLTAAHAWYLGEEDVRAMERAAINDGALIVEDGNWIILNWRRYQCDETNAERQKRFRDSKKTGANKPLRNDSNALLSLRNVEEKRREEKRRERNTPLPPNVGEVFPSIGGLGDLPEEYATDEVRKALNEYLQYRQARRLPKLLLISWERNFAQWQKIGVTAEDIVAGVDATIASGWQKLVVKPKSRSTASAIDDDFLRRCIGGAE